MKRTKMCLFLSVCLLVLSMPVLGSSQEKELAIDPQAERILRQMSDYLNSFEQFTIHAENLVDNLFSSGQKVQLGRNGVIFVRRPDRLRVNIDGDRLSQDFYYNGKTVTLFTKNLNYYATVEAPSNIEDALDHAEQSVGLVAPFSDLLSMNSYAILMEDVESGIYVGLSKVSGIECHHMAFRGEETDWQIWIENSKTPLPRKFVITSKWVTGAPQFMGFIHKWEVSHQLKDDLFTFVPPQGAQQIDFLTPDN